MVRVLSNSQLNNTYNSCMLLSEMHNIHVHVTLTQVHATNEDTLISKLCKLRSIHTAAHHPLVSINFVIWLQVIEDKAATLFPDLVPLKHSIYIHVQHDHPCSQSLLPAFFHAKKAESGGDWEQG